MKIVKNPFLRAFVVASLGVGVIERLVRSRDLKPSPGLVANLQRGRTFERGRWLLCGTMVLFVVALAGCPPALAAPCPNYPAIPMVEGNSIYTDKIGSISDPNGSAKNQQKLAPIDNFLNYLGHTLDHHPSAADLVCPYSLLREWANAQALLRPPETSGRVARIWITPAFLFIALKFRMHGVEITADVKQWLAALAAAERTDYAEPLKKGEYAGLYSNGYPWVGAANALSALIGDNPEAMRFQEEAWRNMLNAIRPDGTLQGELGRGAQALEYHQKAANGLLILLSVRRALGQADDPAQIAQLKRLLNLIGAAFCNPQYLAEAAHATLNIPGVWNFRVSYAFDDGLLPQTLMACGPKSMNWFQAEYSGGDSRESAKAVAAAAARRH